MKHIFAEFPLRGLDYGAAPMQTKNGELWLKGSTNPTTTYRVELGSGLSTNGVAYTSGNILRSPYYYSYDMRYVPEVTSRWSGCLQSSDLDDNTMYHAPITMFKLDVGTFEGYIDVRFYSSSSSSSSYGVCQLTPSTFNALGLTEGIAYVVVTPSSRTAAHLYVNGRYVSNLPLNSGAGQRLEVRGADIASVITAFGYMVSNNQSWSHTDIPAWALRPTFAIKPLRPKKMLDINEAPYTKNNVTADQTESGFKLYDKSNVTLETDYESKPDTQVLSVITTCSNKYIRRSPAFGSAAISLRYGNNGEDGPGSNEYYTPGQSGVNPEPANYGTTLLDATAPVTTRNAHIARRTLEGEDVQPVDLRYISMQCDISNRLT